MLLEMLTNASIHLTGILLLAPHLSVENHAEVLARASFRSKREIQKLVAEIAPRADVEPTVEPLGLRRSSQVTSQVVDVGPLRTPSWAEFTAALAGPVRQLAPSNDRGGAPTAPGATPAPIPRPAPPEATLCPPREGPFAVVDPLSPGRYRVELTVDQHYIDLLEEARDLLAHQIPDRDLAKVHERAMQTLVGALRRQRRAATEKPRVNRVAAHLATPNRANTAGASARAGAAKRADAAVTSQGRVGRTGAGRTGASRYVPAALKRAVWERDCGRCTYVDVRGHRCPETGGVEVHHEQPFAKDGAMTLDNLALRCRPHNDLAAQQDFGREFMLRKKAQARQRRKDRPR